MSTRALVVSFDELDSQRWAVVIRGTQLLISQGGRGPVESHKLDPAGATPAPAPNPQRLEPVGSVLQPLAAPGRPKGVGVPAGQSFLQPGPSPRTSLATVPAKLFCVWCHMEGNHQGHGPAPRITGDMVLHSCADHAGPSSSEAVPCSPPPQSPPVGPEARPAPPLNPNAGAVAAFPKGRWSC